MNALHRSALALLVLVSVPVAALADGHFQVTELAPDLLLLSTDQGSYSNNSLAFTGPDGLLLVDTHGPDDADALAAFVDSLGLGAPRYIVCTHRHTEHIGGNGLWGAEPVIVAHTLFETKLRSGTSLFLEHPPEIMPDLVVDDALTLEFNGETIEMTTIGGSHDDNEIMVHFTNHGVAHISSVVNGFNFPSVDDDGDVLQTGKVARRIRDLLPRDIRLVSGHNGKEAGYGLTGTWDELEPYAAMVDATVALVREGLANGKSVEEMQEADILADYGGYARSYVGKSGWIATLAEALKAPVEKREDPCPVLFRKWKEDGPDAAVAAYTAMVEGGADRYVVNEFILLGAGSGLASRGLHADAAVFLTSNLTIHPDAKYAWYGHYLAAESLEAQERTAEALTHYEACVAIKPDFKAAAEKVAELTEAAR